MHRRREQLFQELCPVINSPIIITAVTLKALYSISSKSINNSVVAIETNILKIIISLLSNKLRCNSMELSALQMKMTVSDRLAVRMTQTRVIALSTSRSSFSRRRIK